jgi:hypothetical protein
LKGDGGHSARDLQNVLVGLRTGEPAPSIQFIENSLTLLSHPTLDLVEKNNERYRLTTTLQSAEDLLTRFSALIDNVTDTES